MKSLNAAIKTAAKAPVANCCETAMAAPVAEAEALAADAEAEPTTELAEPAAELAAEEADATAPVEVADVPGAAEV